MNMTITFPEHLIILDPRLAEDQENYAKVMEVNYFLCNLNVLTQFIYLFHLLNGLTEV